MKKIFKMSNLIPLLLVVYITKSFIVSPSFFDFGVIFLMSISFIQKLSFDKKEVSEKEELLTIITQLEEKVNTNFKSLTEFSTNESMRLQRQMDEDRMALETKISTLNLGMSMTKTKPQEKQANGWNNLR